MFRILMGLLAAHLIPVILFVALAMPDLSGHNPDALEDLVAILVFVSGLVGILVFPLSIFLAFAGRAVKWTRLRTYSVGFALIGLVPFLVFIANDNYFGFRDASPANIVRISIISFMFAMLGAFCGWIYWRIAIRQTPADVRPITTA